MADTKSEFEKMLAGESYLGPDPEMSELQRQAAEGAAAYNAISPVDIPALAAAAETLFGDMGSPSFVKPPVTIDYGFNVSIGSRTFINMNATFLDCGKITIGDSVAIGPNCQFLAVNHPVRFSERMIPYPTDPDLPFRGVCIAAPITIEDECWLGAGTIVLAGVTIGKSAVIGAGSVVTKDIPPGVVAAGNPCRVIRKIED